ncbi:MAG TPA: class I mannose-6-phosphate isomerase [Rectinemataceae bacterium]|nr:class I mannose-6-phosphate isomerase [Rectinemataceae bacterium]
MSFMYNPFPYDDPNAINRIVVAPSDRAAIVKGLSAAASALAKAALTTLKDKGTCVLALDGYISAPFEVLARQVARSIAQQGAAVRIVDVAVLYKEESVLKDKLLRYLPEDRAEDPPLLYGRLYGEGYEGLMDESRMKAFGNEISKFRNEGEGVLITQGNGCLISEFRPLVDLRCYVDITQKRSVLNIKGGRTGNLGFKTQQPYAATLRHAYYVDFEVAAALRGELIREKLLDYYIAADDTDDMRLLPFKTFLGVCGSLASYPFRCRPVYIEGVWGGYYIKHLRRLPESMRNCAWCFDLIPMEVSIVADMDGLQLELPYYCFVQTMGSKIMGDTCVSKFRGYFPIRFNYDDTFHASGNMSIQCHPDSAYVREHNDELGRQDESYYIVTAGQDAKTYCGFQEGSDVEEFIAECKRSESSGGAMDHDKYVRSEPSKPGMQFLIPAGTIHASGRNQVILEIGSLTIGSYTYKMYDYLRKDLDGRLRPIHTIHGDAVLRRERKGDWVKKNLIQEPRSLRKDEGGEEFIVGEHELLYFSLRNLRFARRMTDETRDRFHVLVLVEGEKVMIRSLEDPSRYFIQRYMDMVVVAASFGKYELLNQGEGIVVVHKTLLKDGYETIEP